MAYGKRKYNNFRGRRGGKKRVKCVKYVYYG